MSLYTSEEFFLYDTTVYKWTIQHFAAQNELLTGSLFFGFGVFLLLHFFDVLALFVWLHYVIQSTAPYVIIKFKERWSWQKIYNCVLLTFYSAISCNIRCSN